MNICVRTRPLVCAVLVLLAAAAGGQIQLGQLDDFEGCATDFWFEGAGSPNPPVAVSGCGALNTCCLSNDSGGGFGPGSRQAVLNESAWIGDYNAAAVNKIEFQAANASATETLYLRVGITNGSTCFASAEPAVLPPNQPGPNGLQSISFLLDPSTMTEVTGNSCKGGGDGLATVLDNVVQLRILSAVSPAWTGDSMVSTLQLDGIHAAADSDLDQINDDTDNCTLVANANQRDTDLDGLGNACDADVATPNDCMVDLQDLAVYRQNFLSPGDLDTDNNGDGQTDLLDLSIVRGFFLQPPGPGQGIICGACLTPEPVGANGDFAGLPMFFRGGLINDWGASDSNRFSDQGGGLYVARFEANPGDFEWKIADNDWSIEYCTPTPLVADTPTAAPLFGCTFPLNGSINVPTAGCFEFEMQTDGAVPPNAVDVTFREAAP